MICFVVRVFLYACLCLPTLRVFAADCVRPEVLSIDGFLKKSFLPLKQRYQSVFLTMRRDPIRNTNDVVTYASPIERISTCSLFHYRVSRENRSAPSSGRQGEAMPYSLDVVAHEACGSSLGVMTVYREGNALDTIPISDLQSVQMPALADLSAAKIDIPWLSTKIDYSSTGGFRRMNLHWRSYYNGPGPFFEVSEQDFGNICVRSYKRPDLELRIEADKTTGAFTISFVKDKKTSLIGLRLFEKLLNDNFLIPISGFMEGRTLFVLSNSGALFEYSLDNIN